MQLWKPIDSTSCTSYTHNKSGLLAENNALLPGDKREVVLFFATHRHARAPTPQAPTTEATGLE